MTNTTRNPSKNTPFNSDRTDAALLRLEGVEGLLLMMTNTLEDQSGQLLKSHQYAAMTDVIQALLGYSVDELAQDSTDHTDTIQLLQGTSAALCAFASMHKDECDLLNSGYQLAVLYGLHTVVNKCSKQLINAQEQASKGGVSE